MSPTLLEDRVSLLATGRGAGRLELLLAHREQLAELVAKEAVKLPAARPAPPPNTETLDSKYVTSAGVV